MTGWIIFGAVLLLILIILRLTATVVVDYSGDLLVKISVLGIKIYTYPKKPKRRKKVKVKPKKKKKKSVKQASAAAEKQLEKEEIISDIPAEKPAVNEEKTSDKKADKKAEKKNDEADEKPKPTIREIIELVKVALESVGKPLKKVLKRTTVSHLAVTAVCGGEDAAKAAMNYGTANFLLGTALNLLDEWFTLKEPDVLKISVDFQQEETELDAYVEIRLAVGSALAFALVFLFRGLKRLKANSEAESALEKLIGNKKS